MNTKTQQPLPEIKVTKVMHEKMKLYGVELREEPSVIRHVGYGVETTVSPSVFAMYEVAIKANYVTWFLHHATSDNDITKPDVKKAAQELIGVTGYFNRICDESTPPIDSLPFITDQMILTKLTEGPKAAADYHWAAKHIDSVGLYHDLLD